MSGHSKWSTIKHKKGAQDIKRGKLFSKISKIITIAARESGPDPETNVRLRTAIEKAQEANMPKENIKRAINRGGGSGKETAFNEITYEGYGPFGIAFIITAITDNRNRTTSEIRRIFADFEGNLGETGSAAYLFNQFNQIIIKSIDPDTELKLIEAGAEDIGRDKEGNILTFISLKNKAEFVKNIETQKIDFEDEGLAYIPKLKIELAVKQKEKIIRMIDVLEERDDVEDVWTNTD